jgi:rhodanese-related sulfurtransferase
VKKLVDQPTGKFALIDSRPLPRFQQGTIPGAINVPYPAWDKVVNRLPADKSTLLVFFCQGVTCQMSPLSQRKAIALGYTNTKVYHEGVPEWETKDYLATRPEFVKAAYVDKDIPAVILDVRSTEEAASGHIKGAVSMPLATLKARVKSFPDPKLKAPIIVYDGRGGRDSVAAARALIKAGQTNVQVMEQGLLGWQSAGYTIDSGAPAATKVAYVPKPRPGSIPAEEFRKLATNTPADVLILDVRNQDEANAGMIKGAMLIPDEELLARINELPKDKRIIAHCSTGIRAEMAYHKLKDAGYKAGFLNAEIEIAKNGSFKLTSKL